MTLLSILELFGTVVFAASGALLAIRKDLDLFGVLFLSITPSIGGGLIRDILLNNMPPVALKNPTFCLTAIIVGVITCLFYNKIVNIKNILLIVDAIGLGVFTALGANTAMQNGVDTLYGIVLISVLTGIGGGILRDVFMKEIPYVFQREIYALAALIGALCLCFIYDYFPHIISLYICAFITTSVRLIALKYELNLPVVKIYKSET